MEQLPSVADVLEVTQSQWCLGETLHENFFLSMHKYSRMLRTSVKVFLVQPGKWVRCMCCIVRQDSLRGMLVNVYQ